MGSLSLAELAESFATPLAEPAESPATLLAEPEESLATLFAEHARREGSRHARKQRVINAVGWKADAARFIVGPLILVFIWMIIGITRRCLPDSSFLRIPFQRMQSSC